jgi:hypothetical protein
MVVMKMLSDIFIKSNTLQDNYSKMSHKSYIEESTQLSLEVLNLIDSQSIPNQYSSEFSTVLARSISFYDKETVFKICNSLIDILNETSSIQLQRSYAGIVFVALNRHIKGINDKKNIHPIHLKDNQSYDYELIRLCKYLQK